MGAEHGASYCGEGMLKRSLPDKGQASRAGTKRGSSYSMQATGGQSGTERRARGQQGTGGDRRETQEMSTGRKRRENSALTTRNGFNLTQEEGKRLPGKNVIPRPDESERFLGICHLSLELVTSNH